MAFGIGDFMRSKMPQQVAPPQGFAQFAQQRATAIPQQQRATSYVDALGLAGKVTPQQQAVAVPPPVQQQAAMPAAAPAVRQAPAQQLAAAPIPAGAPFGQFMQARVNQNAAVDEDRRRQLAAVGGGTA